MADQFKIAPSILSADFANLGQEVRDVLTAGADWIHVDVMDGHFVPNLTIGAPVVKSLRAIKDAYLDCHLMIEEPARYIDDFLLAGADNITLHIESQGDKNEMIDKIKSEGRSVGLTLRPTTPLSEIEPYLKKVDLVLVMTVNPGFGGQSFMEDQVDKIETLYNWREKYNYFNYQIQVDGGINDVTKRVVDHADILVAGSFIFKQDNYLEAIEKLREKR